MVAIAGTIVAICFVLVCRGSCRHEDSIQNPFILFIKNAKKINLVFRRRLRFLTWRFTKNIYLKYKKIAEIQNPKVNFHDDSLNSIINTFKLAFQHSSYWGYVVRGT